VCVVPKLFLIEEVEGLISAKIFLFQPLNLHLLIS
jgi:hypothetical protein